MIALWESAAIVCLIKLFHYMNTWNLNFLPAELGKQVLLSLEFQEVFSGVIGKQLTSESINIHIDYTERILEILKFIIRCWRPYDLLSAALAKQVILLWTLRTAFVSTWKAVDALSWKCITI